MKVRAPDDYTAFVLDRLCVLGMSGRAMFGGQGHYRHGVFLGLTCRKRLFSRPARRRTGTRALDAARPRFAGPVDERLDYLNMHVARPCGVANPCSGAH